MKKVLSLVALLGFLGTHSVFAMTETQIEAAQFIASKGIINDNSTDITQYKLSDNITRREMLKVMMNLSGKTVVDSCTGKFSDLDASDWGCKYAEAALAEGYIAQNATFRPNDEVTQIESLKMIMQAKGIERNDADDWREGYTSKAVSEGIIEDAYVEYDTAGLRGWIFANAARSYADFSVETVVDETELTPEEEAFFKILSEGILGQ
ncbi:S-layer homology domain-containing protein [Candidatus Gracilibacteria bacterium]|nr:S-layer homology domain-containing protein [Candidatus Gracilibacteria bacterium]